MARGSGFGALGKNFIIVGNAQHRIFGGHASVLDWDVTTPWWIFSFVRH
jgi:hypothetical protein